MLSVSKWMKSYRQLFLGIIIGGILGTGTIVFADTLATGNIWIKNQIQFVINGQKTELPKDYTVLLYQDRTYVPVRFIAENLNADVTWNQETQTVGIQSKVLVEEGKPESENAGSKENVYKTLPLQKMIWENVYVTIQSIVVDKDQKETRVYLGVENRGDIPIYLDQQTAKIVSEDNEYLQENLHAIYTHDKTWFNDIKKNSDDKDFGEAKGFIKLPLLDESDKQITLSFKLLKNNGSGEGTTVTFDIQR